MRGRAQLTIVFALIGAGVFAQVPDASTLSASRADRLAGLYEFADGTRIHVTDLRDQLGHPVLSVTEYASGRLRALYPSRDNAFSAGSGWFDREPVSYVVRFDEAGGEARAPRLTWTEGGASRVATRSAMLERAVTISHGDVTLAGTLTMPRGAGPHPALVMVPGSGPLTTRTQRLMGDLFTAHGITVLTTDKRGTGGSSGQWNGLSHADWATDVNAEIDWLTQQPDIDRNRIGLYAGSEGGFVAPVVAAARTDVRMLICRVCSALPHERAILDMETGALRRRGLSDDDVRQAGELLGRMIRYARERTGYDALVAMAEAGAGTPWRQILPLPEIPAATSRYWDTYNGVLTVDPREYYPRLRVPTLVILGENDDRILYGTHRAAFDRLAARTPSLALWSIPGGSHGLLLDANSAPHYPAGFHDRLALWARDRLKK